MNPETYLRNRIRKMIQQEFPKAWVYHPADKWRSGVPDFLICWQGLFIAIEVKTPVGVVSKIQFYTLDMIKESRGITAVCRSVDDARKVLTSIKKAL